jgi:hypothetical protein
MKDGNHQFIGDVYYISTIKWNILSLRQLMETSYEIKMKDRILTLLDTHRTMIAKVTMTKNMMFFFLNMEINVSKCLKTCVKYQTWLWHIRLKQVNFDSLKMMMQNEMLKGLPSIKCLNQLCEGCLVGKQFCKSFSKESASRSSQPL